MWFYIDTNMLLTQALHRIGLDCAYKSGGIINFVFTNKCAVVNFGNLVLKIARKLDRCGIDNKNFRKLGIVRNISNGGVAVKSRLPHIKRMYKMQCPGWVNCQGQQSSRCAHKLAGVCLFVGCYLKALPTANTKR